jgi:CheY-like chemotaxis protein
MMTHKKKVLVVDDEIYIIHVVAIKFRNNGYDVIAADNALEAFKLACQEKPDIVVTDFQMPGMTGLDLVRKLRANEVTKDVPVILLTARTFSLDDKQQQDLQIAACVSKPFSPRELLKSVEDILCSKTVV